MNQSIVKGFAALCVAAAAWAGEGDAASQGNQRGTLRAACKEDVAALCQGVKPGGGRLAACLRENKDKVSDGCKAVLKDKRGARPQAQKE